MSNNNSFRVLFDKIASVYFLLKNIFIFSRRKWPAQVAYQHCASCIGTLSLPVTMSVTMLTLEFSSVQFGSRAVNKRQVGPSRICLYTGARCRRPRNLKRNQDHFRDGHCALMCRFSTTRKNNRRTLSSQFLLVTRYSPSTCPLAV